MQLQLESEHLEDYLGEIPPVISFRSPLIRAKISEIKAAGNSLEACARLAFEAVRDEVLHSFDTKDPRVTVHSEDVLQHRCGICFAKSHLLAALLRGMGIPAGFCYQRVLRQSATGESFGLHGLNALYLEPHGWFRVDPRGNKPGVNSQFSPQNEQLAYAISPDRGEVDYPHVHCAPLPTVLDAMRASSDTRMLFDLSPASV